MKNIFFSFGLIGLLLSGCNNSISDHPTLEVSQDEPLAFQQQVLIEAFTSPSCGACPLAHSIIDHLEDSLSTVIHISHKLRGPMTHDYGWYATDQNDRTLFTPLAHVQRLGEDDGMGPVYYRMERFEEMIQGALFSEWTDVGIALETQMQGDEAIVNVTVQSTDAFEESAVELTVVLVQNKIIGEGGGYDQRNYGHSDQRHPYYRQGEWIEGFEHKNVIRHVFTDFAGDVLENEGRWNVSKVYSTDLGELGGSAQDYTVIAFVSRAEERFSRLLNVQFVQLGASKAPIGKY